MKNKEIKIQFIIPEGYIDLEESPIGWLDTTIRDEVRRSLKDTLVEQYLPQIKISKIEITKEEIKEKMLEILAERALDGE